MRAALIAVAAVTAAASTAAADDAKKDTLTVLPWTDASIVFSAKDQRASVAYSQPMASGLRWGVSLSAPLDEESRIAAFPGTDGTITGFKGSFQVGWDPRARELGLLKMRVEAIDGAVRQLQTLTPFEATGAFARGLIKHNVPHGGVTAHFCVPVVAGGTTCTVDALAQHLCTTMFASATCATHPERAQATAAYATTHCIGKPDFNVADEKCFAAMWLLSVIDKSASYAAVQNMADVAEAVNKALPDLPADIAKPHEDLPKGLADPAVRAKVIEKLDAAMRATALERRDLLLHAVGARPKLEHAYAFSGTLSFDRQGVYQDDLAADTVETSSYDLELGLDYTLLPPIAGLSLNARVGFERERASGASVVRRCQEIASTVAGVTGTSCSDKALFRSGAQPAAENGGYVRVAVDYLYRDTPSKDDLVPGIEARAGLEGLGGDKALELRLAFFGVPVKGAAAARVGLAIDATYAIDHDPMSDDPRWTLTPFAFVGATFTDLMSSR